MIGDLSNAPEPIQIKLFNNNPEILSRQRRRPRRRPPSKPKAGVVDVQDGLENTTQRPRHKFQVNPAVASRLGFTTEDIHRRLRHRRRRPRQPVPLITNGRSYTIRIRYPEENRASSTPSRTPSSTAPPATFPRSAPGQRRTELPGQQREIRSENLQREVVVTGRLEGSDLGTGEKSPGRRACALTSPPDVRVEYGGTYQEQQKSFAELTRVLLLALVLVFGVLLAEFRNFSAPFAILVSAQSYPRRSHCFALLITGNDIQRGLFHGPHHGHRHRRQERHPACSTPRQRFQGDGSRMPPDDRHAPGRPPQTSPHPDDRASPPSPACCLWPSPSAPVRRCCNPSPSPSSAACSFPCCYRWW